MRVTVTTGSYPADLMGGAEHQAWLLAQGLAEAGDDVQFLATSTHGETISGTSRVRVVRVPHRRVSGLRRHQEFLEMALQEHAPDICYVRVFAELGMISRICRRHDVPVVSMSCHSQETSPLLLGQNLRETLGHLRCGNTLFHCDSFFAVRSSARHVCITETLREKIKRWLPRKQIRVVYNGSPVPPEERMHVGPSGQVIWVNNLKTWKRPHIFIQLAHRLPSFQFVMIGRLSADAHYTKELQALLRAAPPNFRYLGPLPITTVNELIERSDVLVYTSLPVEGFGNSFVQAWMRGVPTVSLGFDPDGILEREGVGRLSRSFEQLVEDVAKLMRDDELRTAMGRRARNYASRHHSLDRMVADYRALFRELVPG
jgi:glycosyltransferase involved in cell wall biosynthesis